MKNYTSDVFILTLVLISNYSYSGYCSSERLLNLREGDVCRKGDDKSLDHVCRTLNDCSANKLKINNIKFRLCSFDKQITIVCCPPTDYAIGNTTRVVKRSASSVTAKAYSATEKCYEYSKLIYTTVRNPVLLSSADEYIKMKDCFDAKSLIVGGEKAEPKEFPHMALVVYSKTAASNKWACGGSLISEKWILTAAHCEKIGISNYARWARLGVLNYLVNTGGAEPKDYKIVERVKHPDYKPPSYYNDIALFRLEKDVEFSAYIRPICLNTDQLLKSPMAVASGWGQIRFNGPVSPDLLKVVLRIIPINQCNSNKSYFEQTNLRHGIDDASMMCAGFLEGGKDTCGGDSGGPLQITHENYTCMYTQIGVTSFGQFCAQKSLPGVYTKVSKYVSWIEQIVWPRI